MEPAERDRSAPGRAGRVPAAAQPSDATRDTALARAGRLLTHAESLTPAGWRDVIQRARALDIAEHRLALQRLARALDDGTPCRVLDALNHGACAAANGAASGAALADERSAQTCTYAGRVAAHAVLALALAEALPAGDVDLLTSPFRDAAAAIDARLGVARAD